MSLPRSFYRRRQRSRLLKAAVVVTAAAILFTPSADDLNLDGIGAIASAIPLVTTVQAEDAV
ncbi:hypothetical protein [Devosia sp. RR2S18]|uniref:hypothetical protein n=1 Tax=Devosia rhizosphaerae TaxID=3049774 RepID=UPI002541239F|nr:hypothetical protein [Devosia sp. RR2S18]WIJ24460.1 hypothetical protein QOV41_15760 [Devosia sp. RR2S18]HEV7293597.1 hypothetical protein [Devosia sp.]